MIKASRQLFQKNGKLGSKRGDLDCEIEAVWQIASLLSVVGGV
jgi:hypothetical protein